MKVSSMTGFGRARSRLSDAWSAAVVVRSVNHKGLDVQVRHNMREELPEIDRMVRGVVSQRLQRGRVTVTLTFEPEASAPPAVHVDTRVAAALLAQLEEVSTCCESAAPPSVGHVLAVPGVVVSTSVGESLLAAPEQSALEQLARQAVAILAEVREIEGEQLVAQIRSEMSKIEAIVDWLESEQSMVRDRLLERMRERLSAILGPDHLPDQDRLLQEAALLADRADVAEELVRLRSHLGQFSARLEDGGAVGKPLDFLCQELNRELNTVAAKCREVGLTERVVDGKTAIERVREQVQNLE